MSNTENAVQKLKDFIESEGILLDEERLRRDRESTEYQMGMKIFINQLSMRGVGEDEAGVLWTRLSGYTVDGTAELMGKDRQEIIRSIKRVKDTMESGISKERK